MKTIEFKNSNVREQGHIITSFLKNSTPHLAYQFYGNELNIAGFDEVELNKANEFIADVIADEATCLVLNFVKPDEGIKFVEMLFKAASEKVYDIVEVDSNNYIVYFKYSPKKSLAKLREFFEDNPSYGADAYTLAYDGKVHPNNLVRYGYIPHVPGRLPATEWFLLHKDRIAYYNYEEIKGIVDKINDDYLQTREMFCVTVRANGLTSFTCDNRVGRRVYDLLIKELDKLTPVKVGANYLDWIKAGLIDENSKF